MQTEIKRSTDTKVKKGVYQRIIKRHMDFVLAAVGIIILLPVIILIYLLVKIMLGSPVIFKQIRPGLGEKKFTMYKFRTMTQKRDSNGELLPDHLRLTKFGKFLRSSSLDELPELFNIIKGDMSIVGPRPQLVKDLVFMNDKQRYRQTVIPGLTGWAQINGRNCVTWEEKFAYDLEYINNITFLNDFKIIILTVFKVFKRADISTDGMETAEDFGDYLLREKKITEKQYRDILDELKVK